MHCFTETQEVATAAINMGFLVSFSGIVTFKNAVALKEVARSVPLESLLVETDAPYLAPVPQRGKVNRPAWVRYVAEEVARLRGIGVEALALATTANFRRVFSPPDWIEKRL
jgi:TatD DNase family protein